MGKIGRTLVAVGILVGTASSGFTQTAENAPPLLPARTLAPDALLGPLGTLDNPETAERRVELQRWIKEFSAWQEWSAQWQGRRQPGWFTGFRARAQKPEPPPWLAGRCEAVFVDADPLMQACQLLAAWREEGAPAQRIRQVRVAVVTEGEEPPKTHWWENVHVDLMWPAVQWQASIYGVVGTHITTEVGGRLQVFTAPGAMLLNVPTRSGGRVWKFAANYGIGYRVMDFTLPGGRPAELHLNLAKMWLLSDAGDLLTGRTTDVIGFSLTFKRE
jgi:hypothetical protein